MIKFEIFRGHKQHLPDAALPVRVMIECPCGASRVVRVDDIQFESVTNCPAFPGGCPREITVRLLFDPEVRCWQITWREAATKACSNDMVRFRLMSADERA